MIEISLVLWWIWIYWQAALDYPSVVSTLFEWGPLFGQIAVILYMLTLVPGIITRLQWKQTVTQPVASILILFRRHLGILMFITAFLHLTFKSTLPYLASFNFQPPPGLQPLLTYQIIGAVGWSLLFPLWLTSNDWSFKKLGKWWKRIHRLTYIALFFIFLHVVLQAKTPAILLGLVLFFEILSWIIAWRRK